MTEIEQVLKKISECREDLSIGMKRKLSLPPDMVECVNSAVFLSGKTEASQVSSEVIKFFSDLTESEFIVWMKACGLG